MTAALPPISEIERIIAAALAEDVGAGDATSNAMIDADATATLTMVTRQRMVMCGAPIAEAVFHALDKTITVEPLFTEGEGVCAGMAILRISGPARALLTAERTALNLMQRMAAIASATRGFVEAVAGTKAKILDTRKTMPGLRALDKYAVRIGGGENHRMGLFDAMMIKDNHVALAGGIAPAVARAAANNPQNLPIILEVDTLAQLKEALACEGISRVLLDNMTDDEMREAVRMVAGKFPLEASGGITLARAKSIAETGVDYLSIGRITHSVPAVDIGLDVVMNEHETMNKEQACKQ